MIGDYAEQTPIATPAPSYSSEDYENALKLLEIGDPRELRRYSNLIQTANEELHKEKGYFSIFERDKYIKALKHKINSLCLEAIVEELEEKKKEFTVLMDVRSVLRANYNYDTALQHYHDALKQLEAAYQEHRVKYKEDGSCIVQDVDIADVNATLHIRKEQAETELNALTLIRDRKAKELKLEEENNDKET